LGVGDPAIVSNAELYIARGQPFRRLRAGFPPLDLGFNLVEFLEGTVDVGWGVEQLVTSAQLAMLWEGIDWRRLKWGAPPARAA